jgi:hypothetical protein
MPDVTDVRRVGAAADRLAAPTKDKFELIRGACSLGAVAAIVPLAYACTFAAECHDVWTGANQDG